MNLRYLLDTNTLSAVIAPKPNRNVVTRLGHRGSHCAIASVVWNELVYGLNRLPEGKRKAELEAFLYDVVLKSRKPLGTGSSAHDRKASVVPGPSSTAKLRRSRT